MPSLERSDVERGLQKKGFRLEREKTGHRHYRLWHNGQKTPVLTMVSHGTQHKTIDKSTVGHMARQVRLSGSEFENLVNCPLTEDEYIKKLRAAGLDLGDEKDEEKIAASTKTTPKKKGRSTRRKKR